MENKFTDFGHPDWIALKNDAQELLQYYPKRTLILPIVLIPVELTKYLIICLRKGKIPNKHFKDTAPFFYDGIVHKTCISGQGFNLKYWDIDLIQAKKALFDSISFESLYEYYDYENMLDEGVYKIEQFHRKTQELEQLFINIKQFLASAVQLKGYVLVIKN